MRKVLLCEIMSVMKFLFVHQNFPGQYRHLAIQLAENPSYRVIGLGEATNLTHRPALHPRIQTITYPAPPRAGENTHHYLRDYEGHLRRAQAVVKALLPLQQSGFKPDVVAAHMGWGEALFLRDLFPQARHIYYCEFYYQGTGADYGFDPDFPASFDGRLRMRIKNSTQLPALVACDVGVSPTAWQKSRYPSDFQNKIKIQHEGIDTRLVAPDPQARLTIGGKTWQAGEEIVTYVGRNLEPYRGFHTFMRALPHLQALRPHAQVLITGGDGVSYGQRLEPGESYRQKYCAQLGDSVDWNRVHFLGLLSYRDFIAMLQVSAAHVYLSYPFVLSWSLLEALSAGCVVVGSDTAPVTEVIRHGDNGLLTDFFNAEQLAATLAQVLDRPQDVLDLRARARATVVDTFDLHSRCLPDSIKLYTGQP
jgi:glycosyltransferase involved in cell wall biosynthesis